MKRLLQIVLPAVLLLMLSGPAWSQEYNEWEIFGGFDYLNARACIPTYGCSVPVSASQSISLMQAAYGWHVTVGENKTRWFGGVMDFSGDYANRTINFGTSPSPLNVRFNGSAYPFLFGPRFYLRRGRLALFGNPLIGGMHARLNVASSSVLIPPGTTVLGVTIPSLPLSQTKWAYAFGGGGDYRLTEHIALRAEGEWIRSHFPETLDRDFQNNYRMSGGIVFEFGG